MDTFFVILMFVVAYFLGMLTVLLGLVVSEHFRSRSQPNSRVSPFLKKCPKCNGTGAVLEDMGGHECYYCRGTGLTIDPPE